MPTIAYKFNVPAQAGTIKYSNGSTGTPGAASVVIVDRTQPLVGLRGQSKITMTLDTQVPAQNIV